MSDSTAARPKPRPKPKPKPKANALPESSATPSEASGSSLSIPQASSNPATRYAIDIDDSDDMFIQANKSQKEVSSDSDDALLSPSKRKKKRKQETTHVPLWQKHKDITRLLSQDLSDDSDLEILGGSTTPNASKSNGKRKRKERSRSRSITPPPALPEEQIKQAKAVVRNALQLPARAPSPMFDGDESTDTIVFQPELTAIANGLRGQSVSNSTPAPEPANEDNLLLTIKFKRHPLSPHANEPDQEWQYKIERSDSFHDLFEAVAEDASIQQENLIMTYLGKRFFASVTPEILRIWTETADMVAYEKTTYEYIHDNPAIPRYTPSQALPATPGSSRPALKPFMETIEIDSNSDDEDVSNILGPGGLGYSAPSLSPSPPSVHSHSQSQGQTQTHESDAEPESDTLRLTLRSASTQKDITLTVRSTAKCGAIVKAFLKKAGLSDQYPNAGSDEPPPAPAPQPKRKGGRKSKATLAAEAAALIAAAAPQKDPRLYIEGEKIDHDAVIGQQDVEDGDMVEVVGL
ncbi:hypothetical protein D9613_005828 [Agrocybe pediades]|uniref:Rad60/SUMO-like domain-containing protein n=1 Tax=Agrocybe pediades TaxID=84607 RepID=A0A8H4QV14_9AGAR|nr:hypothetical protein D9613_005828 [Agrocybe pediades]